MMTPVIYSPKIIPLLSASQISILSWNILLPNSKDGWWCYKMYSPRHNIDPELTAWPARCALIREAIEAADADVVCLQELSAGSFAVDFAFMAELGYSYELYKKGRFRPATFWKSSRVELVDKVLHRDRCLVTQFRPLGSKETEYIKRLWVANVHLQAGGSQSARRLRQAHDCIDVIRKEQAKLMTPSGKKKSEMKPTTGFSIVFAGDTNIDNQASSGVDATLSSVEMLLLQGEVPAGYVEDGEVVTSKCKTMGHISPFIDTYQHAYSTLGHTVPPSMVVEELYSKLTVPNEIKGTLDLSVLAVELLGRAYDSFASILLDEFKVMGTADVERWLICINGQVGRGSEFRAAVAAMSIDLHDGENELVNILDDEGDEAAVEESVMTPSIPPNSVLTRQMFLDIYASEIVSGKVWGVSYDLAACGHPLPASDELFSARYDRIFLQGSAQLLGVRSLEGGLKCLPNADHPSDHLALHALIEWL